MTYDVILMDIDNTLLDFHAGTREALEGLLANFGLELTQEREARFHVINNQLWTAYEHGAIPKSAIFERRFAEYLGEMGIELQEFADFSELPGLLTRAINGDIQPLNAEKRALFPQLYSWDAVRESWLELYEE